MLFSGSQINNVTLADSAANYDHVLIRYRDSDGQVCQPIVAKNGETVSFVSIYTDANGTYIKQQKNVVSGSTIKRSGAWQRTLMSGAASSGEFFSVIEVIGFKWL